MADAIAIDGGWSATLAYYGQHRVGIADLVQHASEVTVVLAEYLERALLAEIGHLVAPCTAHRDADAIDISPTKNDLLRHAIVLDDMVGDEKVGNGLLVVGKIDAAFVVGTCDLNQHAIWADDATGPLRLYEPSGVAQPRNVGWGSVPPTTYRIGK